MASVNRDTSELCVDAGDPTMRFCYRCDKLFPSLNDLSDHTETYHIQMTPHGCDYCTMNFTAMNDLKVHLEEKHISECTELSQDLQQLFQCNLCADIFSDIQDFDLHVEMSHTASNETDGDACISVSEYESLESPPYTIPQNDGNDSLGSLSEAPGIAANSSLRIAPYILNRDKQMARLGKNSKIEDFTIEVTDPTNVNIQCSTGFFIAVAKPSLTGLLGYSATISWFPIRCYEDSTSKLDQLNRNVNHVLV